jgi:hypothetical protein
MGDDVAFGLGRGPYLGTLKSAADIEGVEGIEGVEIAVSSVFTSVVQTGVSSAARVTTTLSAILGRVGDDHQTIPQSFDFVWKRVQNFD